MQQETTQNLAIGFMDLELQLVELNRNTCLSHLHTIISLNNPDN